MEDALFVDDEFDEIILKSDEEIYDDDDDEDNFFAEPKPSKKLKL